MTAHSHCTHDEGERCDCAATPPTTGRPRPNAHATRALRLAAQGWPTDRIAAEIGCSRRSVQRYLQGAPV